MGRMRMTTDERRACTVMVDARLAANDETNASLAQQVQWYLLARPGRGWQARPAHAAARQLVADRIKSRLAKEKK